MRNDDVLARNITVAMQDTRPQFKVFQFGTEDEIDEDGVLVVYADPERICVGCRAEVHNLYTLAETQEQADLHLKVYKIALCGDCLCEVMSLGGHTVLGSQVD